MGKVIQLSKYALKREEEEEWEELRRDFLRDYNATLKANQKRKEIAYAEINYALLDCGLDLVQMGAVSDALRDGKIPHVTINIK